MAPATSVTGIGAGGFPSTREVGGAVAEPATLAGLLDVGCARDPSQTAVADVEHAWTYGDLSSRADALASALQRDGLRHGDRVAIVCGNENRFVLSLVAVWRAGAVAVLPNSRLPAPQIRELIDDSGALTVLVGRSFSTVPFEVSPGVRVWNADDIDALTPASASERPLGAPAASDLAMQPYTSGSTGKPKGVLLDHAGQLHNAAAMASINNLTADDVALVSGPAFHANALAGSILPTLLVGGTVAFVARFDPDLVASAVARHRCTFMAGVPAMYRMLLDSGSLARHDVSSLRLLLCGSAPVTAALLGQLEAALPGVDVVEGYGLTEGGPVVTENPRRGPRKLGSIGPPLPGVDVRLVHGGRDAPAGEAGEILVRGPGVMRGYHNRPEATAERLMRDGWLRTGDRAHRDKDGYLYFAGRVDDMINVGGENLYPAEVEARIIGVEGVAEVVVVAAPHHVKGEVPVAFVVAKPGHTVVPDQVRQHCLAAGPAYAHPRHVVVLDRMPLTAIGKPDRRELVQRAAQLPTRGSPLDSD